MPAILEFNGIRITVPTSELAQAITQLQQVSSSPEPAMDILDTVAHQGRKKQDAVKVDHKPIARRTPRKSDDIRAAISFLEMVCESTLFGTRAGPEAAMALFQVQHARGLGSKLAAVNRLIDSHGFAIPDVYITARDTQGSFWRSSQHIGAAIDTLKMLIVKNKKSNSPKEIAPAFPSQKSNSNSMKEEHVQPQHNEKGP